MTRRHKPKNRRTSTTSPENSKQQTSETPHQTNRGGRELDTVVSRASLTTNEATNPPSPKANDGVDLEKAAIAISPTQYIPLGRLVALAVALVGTSVTLVHFFESKPLSHRIEDLEGKLKEANGQVVDFEAKNRTLESQRHELSRRHDELVKEQDRPVLSYPRDDSSIIGKEVTFAWEYRGHTDTVPYIFELRQLSPTSRLIERSSVIRPETKRLHVSLDVSGGAEYGWRICPGTIVANQEARQGEWSHTNHFSVFETVAQRIRVTQKVRVASTPTSYDSFVAGNGRGDYQGFEIELLRWIVPRLASHLQLDAPPTIQFVEVPWNRLFHSLQNGEVDVAVRSISRSKTRERQLRNVRFSEPYLQNHQIFIRPTQAQGDFPECLRGCIVGVKTDSINDKAARHLAQRFRFTVDASYTAYGDLYQALEDGKIPFGLVDSVLVAKFLGSRFNQCGESLDNELLNFYHQELGYGSEDYAAATHFSSSKEGFLDAFNAVLGDPTTQQKIRELRAEYKLR